MRTIKRSMTNIWTSSKMERNCRTNLLVGIKPFSDGKSSCSQCGFLDFYCKLKWIHDRKEEEEWDTLDPARVTTRPWWSYSVLLFNKQLHIRGRLIQPRR